MQTIFLPLLLCALYPSLGNAQTNTTTHNGEAELGGGIGNANPLSAGFKGEFGNKLKLMPMFHINCINRNGSETDEDMNFTYTGVMPLSNSKGYGYESHSNTLSNGFDLDYGLAAKYQLNQHNSLSASVKGKVLRLDTEGTRTETNYVPGTANPFSTVRSTLDGTTRNNDIEVAAGYRYLTLSKPGFSDGFAIDYTYSRSQEKMNRNTTVTEQYGFQDFTLSDLCTDGISEKHRVQGTWMKHVSTVQLNLAAFFEDRLVTSTDHQWFEGLNNHARQLESYDEEFRHRYNTTGAFLSAGTKISNVSLNARLEYDYTYMEGRHLNDFLPTASIDWNVNRSNTLSARYVRRLIRPSLELLNPARISGTFTCDYSNPDLIGMHVNNITLAHSLRLKKVSFNTTLQHIFSNDGFNALWMERSGVRNYTWGNEGQRRAYSLTENIQVTPAEGTKLTAQANVIWDKRIAQAIHMQNEHWGVTTQIGVEQKVAKSTFVNAHGIYSEGNTVDLYSHEGRTLGAGASVRQNLCKNLQLVLNYDYRDYADLVITQGAYTGSLYNRNANRHTVTLNLLYRL